MTAAYTKNEILDVDAAQLFPTLATLTAYMLAGKATFTVYSAQSGQRYTFRVRAAKVRGTDGKLTTAHQTGPWTVEARDGAGFVHLGVIKIYKGRAYFFQDFAKSRVTCLDRDHKARLCFEDLWSLSQSAGGFPAGVVAWHHNLCGRCELPLTTEYRHLGYGPTCCGAMGLDDKRIFRALRDAAGMDERARCEMVREMVHEAVLTQGDGLFLRLLPGLAGDYARNSLSCRRTS
jgi:hypothetical protein